MQEIRSSNSPVVTGICDPNKSRTRHHRNLKLGSKLKYLYGISKNDGGFNNVLRIFRNTLDKLAPRKKKYIRSNNAPFMNKTFNKGIMKRPNLRHKYLKYRNEEDRKVGKDKQNKEIYAYHLGLRKLYIVGLGGGVGGVS